MSVLFNYYKTIVRQDLLTKYNYTNFAEIPRLQKICLNFQVSQSSLRQLLPLMTALTLASFQKPSLLRSKQVNLILRLKKGSPIGCQVILRGQKMYSFLETLLFFIFPQIKGTFFSAFRFVKKVAFFSLENPFLFREIEKEYENFQELPFLHFSMVFTAEKKEEIVSFLSALKFPVKK
jgi:large subunit ribosomal protein L5